MLNDASASACPDGPLTYAQRIARIAQSPAAQAAVDQAAPFTREQLDIARAACASAAERYRERETAPRVPVDHGALARRRDAALRLPPLADGRRDPMDLVA